ncbi:unnamed protein product [Chrysodeixis includens]|uniref:Uncharacterized protein n=1 Tax=Chrysodeixis includens TaxID=689277 RepID=A0A9N8KWJ3_CHRIL|nr:unnamed protein product [Chrysodeixis includens]
MSTSALVTLTAIRSRSSRHYTHTRTQAASLAGRREDTGAAPRRTPPLTPVPRAPPPLPLDHPLYSLHPRATRRTKKDQPISIQTHSLPSARDQGTGELHNMANPKLSHLGFNRLQKTKPK